MLNIVLWSSALLIVLLILVFSSKMSRLLDFIVRKVRFVLDLIAFILGAIFYPSKQRYLPPITNNLLLEPATKLASRIKSGKLKSEDLVRAYVERCKAVNNDLNAIIDDNYEEALNEARQVDERVARELRGEKQADEISIQQLPFLGIPFTTKNSISVKGKTFSGGITARKGIKAENDSTAIARMKKAGAIFLGVSNIPELVMWIDSFNRVDGQTNNPYDKSRIPGGSSGGEGAIIGAAGSIIGVGSDIGGSIRIPSHFNGIFGHKTTPAVVDPTGIFPAFGAKCTKLLSIGPMCRYACDLRPMLKVLVDNKLDLPEKPLNYSTLNLYYLNKIDDPMATPVDPCIEQGLDRVIKYFIGKGTRCLPLDTEQKFYDLRYGMFLWQCAMCDPDQPSYLNMLTEGKRSSINPYFELLKCIFGLNHKYTAALLTLGIGQETGVTSGEYKKKIFEAILERLKSDLHSLLDTNGVLLCPAFPEIAFKHNQSLLKFSDVTYTALFNALDVAITTVPLGLDRHGMPFAVQVIVSPYNDNLSIQVAEELEKSFGGWVPPCGVQFAD